MDGGSRWRRWVHWTAFGATAANLVSIAVAHTLLVAGLAGLLVRPSRIRVPRAFWPILALVAWTCVSIALSDDPAAALPQVKKFLVFGFLPLAYTALRTPDLCQRAVQAWFVVTFGACLVHLTQFGLAAVRAGSLGGEFYRDYVGERIAGFFSHWMTFSQTAALILVTLACYLLFAGRRPGRAVWAGVGVVVGAALLLSFTRSAWLALVVCGLYLVVVVRPKLLPVVPVVLAVACLVAPEALQQRVKSIRPADNEARIVMWRTGVNMIAAHPLTGVGPERVGPLFAEYQPDDVQELPSGFYGHLHNVFIHYAAERGIPAALIVVWLFAQVLFDMRRGLKRCSPGRRDGRFLLHAGVVGTLAIGTLSCFDVSLGDSEVLAAYLGIVAVAYRGIPDTSA